MKKLKEIFPKISTQKIEKIFASKGLTIPSDYFFSSVNVVIGPNGCGKTRFLSALQELYTQNGGHNIVYCNFPNVAASKPTQQPNFYPKEALSAYLARPYIDFGDFLHEIEIQGERYVESLIGEYISSEDKRRNERAEDIFCKRVADFIKYDVKIENNKFYLFSKNEKPVLMVDKIKTFSPGQLMLFYMAIFFSLQDNDDKKVIILDEPESHLHPEAAVQLFEGIQNLKNVESIWIATHNIFVIPELRFESIVYFNDGKLLPRNHSMYSSIITGMLGKYQENSAKFLISLPEWQYSTFMAQCFLDPTTVDTINSKDEQVLKFSEFLRGKSKISVLDFGGGNGRLGFSLQVANHVKTKKVIYEICDLKISEEVKKAKYKTYDDISAVPNGRYDCVAMINVLHEIEPKDWPSIFHSISSKMKDESYLVFSEVHTLSEGEKPGNSGYMVLGPEELTEMFAVPAGELKEINLSDKKKTFCIPIKKTFLENISEATVDSAIRLLEKRSYEALKKFVRMIRKKDNMPFLHNSI